MPRGNARLSWMSKSRCEFGVEQPKTLLPLPPSLLQRCSRLLFSTRLHARGMYSRSLRYANLIKRMESRMLHTSFTAPGKVRWLLKNVFSINLDARMRDGASRGFSSFAAAASFNQKLRASRDAGLSEQQEFNRN